MLNEEKRYDSQRICPEDGCDLHDGNPLVEQRTCAGGLPGGGATGIGDMENPSVRADDEAAKVRAEKGKREMNPVEEARQAVRRAGTELLKLAQLLGSWKGVPAMEFVIAENIFHEYLDRFERIAQQNGTVEQRAKYLTGISVSTARKADERRRQIKRNYPQKKRPTGAKKARTSTKKAK